MGGADPEEAPAAGRARHGADLRRENERNCIRLLRAACRARVLGRRAARAGEDGRHDRTRRAAPPATGHDRRCRDDEAQARVEGPRAPVRARLRRAFLAAHPAGERGLRLRFSGRHGAHARTGDPLDHDVFDSPQASCRRGRTPGGSGLCSDAPPYLRRADRAADRRAFFQDEYPAPRFAGGTAIQGRETGRDRASPFGPVQTGRERAAGFLARGRGRRLRQPWLSLSRPPVHRRRRALSPADHRSGGIPRAHAAYPRQGAGARQAGPDHAALLPRRAREPPRRTLPPGLGDAHGRQGLRRGNVRFRRRGLSRICVPKKEESMPLSEAERKKCVETLLNAEKEKKQAVQLSVTYPHITIEDSYAISTAVAQHKIKAGARLIGHKVGLTSKAMQASSQINEPDYGHLLDYMMIADGAKVPHANYCVPRVEIELAFILGRPLKGPGIRS